MNFEFFSFMVFMSIVSFAVAFIAYYLVVKTFGKEGSISRMAQIILVPLAVVAYDMFCFYVDDSYRFFVGCIPLAGIVGLTLYAYFFKGSETEGFLETPQQAAARTLVAPEKKPSKKSQRIHDRRKKRGAE